MYPEPLKIASAFFDKKKSATIVPQTTEDEIPDDPDAESDVPDKSDAADADFAPDDPGAEDDESDWYEDDSPEEEPDDGWPEAEDEAETEKTGEENSGLTWEEEIALLYEGSLIRYAIDYDGYAYVKTAQPVTVYGDSRMNADSELCKIMRSDAVLLATGFDTESGGTCAIRVWFVAEDMEPVEGFIRESAQLRFQALSGAKARDQRYYQCNKRRMQIP